MRRRQTQGEEKTKNTITRRNSNLCHSAVNVYFLLFSFTWKMGEIQNLKLKVCIQYHLQLKIIQNDEVNVKKCGKYVRYLCT